MLLKLSESDTETHKMILHSYNVMLHQVNIGNVKIDKKKES